MGVTTSGFAREPVRGRYRLAPLFSLATLVLVQGCGSLPTSTDEPLFQRRYRGYTYCTVGVVKQSRHDTCGPACLSSVLTYWDIALPESGILEKYPTPEPRSYLLLELRAIAEAEGLKAYAISMDEEPRHKVEEQISKGRPLICAVRPPIGLYLFDPVPILGPAWRALAWTLYPRKEHFVVVAGLDPQRLLIMDPAYGFATLPWSRFEAAWSQMKHACLLVAQ